ncbi:hypothetical protein ACTG9Q_24965 [Actinokineospora sp. 24-640]
MTDPVERVLVVLADSGLARLPEVVAGLEAAGLLVEEILDAVGVITGTIEHGAISALLAIDGVDDIEPVTTVQLPHPDSELQ